MIWEREEKDYDLKLWHKWFAWYPVGFCENRKRVFVWWSPVWRRCIGFSQADNSPVYEYSLNPPDGEERRNK